VYRTEERPQTAAMDKRVNGTILVYRTEERPQTAATDRGANRWL